MANVDRPSAASFALSVDPTRAGFTLLAACILVFVAAQVDLWSRNGFWIDEYFSLWASDPALPLTRLLTERILPDTNPPLYFSLLSIIRLVIDDPRSAFLVLNVAAIALTTWYVFARGRAGGAPATALLAIALFLISGPVLYYAPEGRAYLFGLCAAFAIAWSSAQALEQGQREKDIFSFAVLGALAALSHVFAALFAGAFAAGLLLEAVVSRRTELLRIALALGVSATVVCGVWLIFALPNMSNVGWIEFSLASVREALWYVRELTFGHAAIAFSVVAFMAWSARRRTLWPQVRLFVIAMTLFAILPILASFFTPLITGRYWLIGAPAILVFVALALSSEFKAASNGGPPARAAAVTGAFGAALILAASVLGFANAQTFMMAKPVWRGTQLVAPLLENCPAGSVRVWDNHLYATASGAPTATFVEVSEYSAPVTGDCPVLGWAEHVRLGDEYLQTASDAELLALMNIPAAPAEVRIARHSSGFVVLRADGTRGGT